MSAVRAGRRTARVAGLAALLLAAPGCSGAIWSEFAQQSGRQPHDRVAAESLLAEATPDKASVLASLGPPGEVLALRDGDLFVYRLRLTDVQVLNISPGLFTGVYVPVYGEVNGRQGDDVLFVQFDADGRVCSVASGRAP